MDSARFSYWQMMGSYTKTSKDSQEAAKAVQLIRVSKWCRDTGSLINPAKVQTLWCNLDNRAAGKPVPAVSLDVVVVE